VGGVNLGGCFENFQPKNMILTHTKDFGKDFKT
jgi:hypothetical protein